MLLLFSIVVFSQMHFFHQHTHESTNLFTYLFHYSVHIKQILSWIAVGMLVIYRGVQVGSSDDTYIDTQCHARKLEFERDSLRVRRLCCYYYHSSAFLSLEISGASSMRGDTFQLFCKWLFLLLNFDEAKQVPFVLIRQIICRQYRFYLTTIVTAGSKTIVLQVISTGSTSKK